jgi:hypothetical protein
MVTELERTLLDWEYAYRLCGIDVPLLIPVAGDSKRRARRQFRIREVLTALEEKGMMGPATASADGGMGGVVVRREK